MEYFWEYWYWYWFLVVVFYYTAVLEKSVGIKSLLATPVRYYPPKGVGVLLSGVIYDRFTEHKDFVAAILELKVLGYVEIEKQDNDAVLITRQENTPAMVTPQVAYMLEKVLFPGARTSYLIPRTFYMRDHQNELSHSQRFDEIAKDYYQTGIKAAEWAVNEGYMEENPKKQRSRFVWWSILLVVLMLLMVLYSGMVSGFFAFVSFFFIYFPIFFVVYHKNLFAKLFAALFPLMIISLIVLNGEFREVLFEELHLWLYIVVGMVQGAFILIYEHVGSLTPKGKEIRNHLMGFKTFLQRVKLDEVQRRKEEDPEYVDRVLPYMVLFGIEAHALNLEELKYMAR